MPPPPPLIVLLLPPRAPAPALSVVVVAPSPLPALPPISAPAPIRHRPSLAPSSLCSSVLAASPVARPAAPLRRGALPVVVPVVPAPVPRPRSPSPPTASSATTSRPVLSSTAVAALSPPVSASAAALLAAPVVMPSVTFPPVPIPPLLPEARSHIRRGAFTTAASASFSGSGPSQRPLQPPRRRHLDGVGVGRLPVGHGQAERARERVLLGRLDGADLVAAPPLAALLLRLARACVSVSVSFLRASLLRGARLAGLRVPVQLPPLLPPPHRRLQRVAQVVLPPRRPRDRVPAELHPAARARLAHRREEIHFGRRRVVCGWRVEEDAQLGEKRVPD